MHLESGGHLYLLEGRTNLFRSKRGSGNLVKTIINLNLVNSPTIVLSRHNHNIFNIVACILVPRQ
jgi:hypothetical protein